MSFGTTYFPPATPLGRELDFTTPGPRQSLHQRSCSGGAYSEDLFLVSKLGRDPRDFYVEDNRDIANPDNSTPYLPVDQQLADDVQKNNARLSSVPKPRDGMRIQRILNANEEALQQQQQQQQQQVSMTQSQQQTTTQVPQTQPQLTQAQNPETDHYHNYPYHDGTQSFQAFSTAPALPTTFPMSPCSPLLDPVTSLPPMAVSATPTTPGALPTTLATMSPLAASFPTISQPTLIFEDVNVMPYSYNLQSYSQQPYSFKHAGNAKPLDQSTFVGNSTQCHSGHAHQYPHSPDPSGSPSVLSSFPQRAINSLVDHQYPVPDSPPNAFYHTQNQAPSPYSVGSHSPISNGSYTPAHINPGTPGSGPLTPTPPTTPHYGFSHTDPRYTTGNSTMSLYSDHFTLQSQAVSPRTHRPPTFLGGPVTPTTPTSSITPGPTQSFRVRSKPYEHGRTGRSNDHSGNPAPRRFQCLECEKAFPTKGELKSHERCHLKVPAFLCGTCGRPFKRRTDFVRHVRNVHEEVGRYCCPHCNERFGRLDKLKRHEKRGCHADKEEAAAAAAAAAAKN